jgi:mRNA-degrading endonuclease HigB of HigAB toxin-antitoxin module
MIGNNLKAQKLSNSVRILKKNQAESRLKLWHEVITQRLPKRPQHIVNLVKANSSVYLKGR